MHDSLIFTIFRMVVTISMDGLIAIKAAARRDGKTAAAYQNLSGKPG